MERTNEQGMKQAVNTALTRADKHRPDWEQAYKTLREGVINGRDKYLNSK